MNGLSGVQEESRDKMFPRVLFLYYSPEETPSVLFNSARHYCSRFTLMRFNKKKHTSGMGSHYRATAMTRKLLRPEDPGELYKAPTREIRFINVSFTEIFTASTFTRDVKPVDVRRPPREDPGTKPLL